MAEIAETVYGTNEEGHVMSEKVSALATNVYKEFERMIKKYDEDVVKELMPLTVGLLEGLDQALQDKQESDVELELLRDDNEQLLTQYEREKQLRKVADQKYLEMEDSVEGEKKELQEKIESLESIVRMLELKAKNSSDHVSRLEEKEADLKKDYNKLHERYTELFRTHMDYMERTKILLGTDRPELSNSPRNKGFNLPNLRPVSMFLPGQSATTMRSLSSPTQSIDINSPRSTADSTVSLKSELADLESPEISKEKKGKLNRISTCDKEQVTDHVEVKETSTGMKKDEKEETQSDTQNQIDSDNLNSVQNDENSQENYISDHIHSQNSGEQLTINQDINTLDNLETSKLDNSVTNTVTPEKDSHVKNVVTSTPNPKHRMRCDSMDEPEFEEDKIFGLDHALAQIVATTPELQELEESSSSHKSTNNSLKNMHRNNESIFDELTCQDADIIGDVDFGADITGREVNPGDYASSVSDNFFGMGKELENIILENTELLETKNALNIVKDDLIAKVDELTGELEICREELSSLQTVKTKLQERMKSQEDEIKKMKEELEKKTNSAKEGEEEDDVPMAQRKRFTRVEMARVLMERNQYKERLMELQEAVRWTEMIRASREHPEIATTQKQKKSSIWNLSEFSKKLNSFSNLFSSSNKPNKKPYPMATVKYNAPTTQVQPVGDPNKRTRKTYNLGDKAKAYDFMQDELKQNTADDGSSKIESLLEDPVLAHQHTVMSEKAKKEREKERMEQYKQVRAHVKKDDGRLQAYGWSLPAKLTSVSRDAPSKSHVPVPVPVYCRPLLERDEGLKIWCAAGVNLTGGRTRDGGSIVGASVFYSDPGDFDQETKKEITKDDVEKLNHELKEHEKNLKDSGKEQLSSYVWICTSTSTESRVVVIDANCPGEILETFRVSTASILCIASIAGALESDYPVDEEILKAESYPQYNPPPMDKDNQATDSGIGDISFVQCVNTGKPSSKPTSPMSSPFGSPKSKEISPEHRPQSRESLRDEKNDSDQKEKSETDRDSLLSEQSIEGQNGPAVFKAKGSPVSSGRTTPISTASDRSLDRKTGQDDSDLQFEEAEKMSSILPTMWLASQSGSLYVHSAVSQWRRCLHSVKLEDAVLNIVHVKGRVLVALANGKVAIFHRAIDGQWDLQNYHLLDLGKPHHSIRCMSVIANNHVWCGYRNKIHVVDPESMSIMKTFDAHPRKESQVRQLAWLGDGVWVSIRLDSTLRLYHAYTHQHLQDVDIEPYVSKMLGTGKLGFSFVRITSMLISCQRLWIGTGNGVVISVPLSESNKQTVSSASSGGRPGGIIRVYSDNKTDSVTPGSFIPYCTMAQAQLSFHGHRDAVKFFVSVPGAKRKGLSGTAEDTTDTTANKIYQEATPAPPSNSKLVLSGGEGYVDFRIGLYQGDGEDDEILQEDEKKLSLSKGERSHLIVWEVTSSS
ncbi:C-Jun-amino-terminal kinase-interacting protein 4-like isoform X7 [Mytilus californianus]|uniref:C-Jun-amino-terminal kinase-interacting protein 4-like isoform X7 n=1 Tax=Mytilus californianus TaxID=6549 RepID=UPI0022478359|nr:C-Jun-amino-terminal kinase-interacting protein 4-like isoform X7 [Mytilus californianus]